MRELTPGSEIAGYRIEACVGRGGMGVVYRALEIELGRVVALKVIAPELVEDDDVRARFLREARAAAAIEHPHVIPVHAAGERDGIAYLAMRFIDADDLRARVRRTGPLRFERALEVLEQAAAGLDAIHHAGFVHRDIKPANLLIDAGGHVYVTDFGLAKDVLSRSSGTSTGKWVGTLDYIAPEQIRGGPVDARADIYALGGVLHYALTAHVPFERHGDEAKLWAQLSEPPPTASHWRPDVSPALDTVITRAMAKRADERFPSAGDLARAARAAVAGTEPAMPERMVARGPAAPSGALPEPALEPDVSTVTAAQPTLLLPARRRARWALPAGALIVLIVGGVVAGMLLRDDAGGGADNGARGNSALAKPAPHLEIDQTIPDVGHRPNSVVLAGDDLWVTGGSHERIYRIDRRTGHKRAKSTRVGRRPNSMVAYGDTLWIALTVDRRLVGIDVHDGRVTHRVPLGARGLQVAADASGTWVLVTTSERRFRVAHYDPHGRLRARFALEHSASALTAGGGGVWVASLRGPVIARLNRSTGELSTLATMPGPVAALRWDGGYLWAVLTGLDTIIRVDPKTGNKAAFAAGSAPGKAIVVGRWLVVSSSNDQRVRLFDAKTLEQVDDLVVGLNPFSLASVGRSIWVARLGDDTVSRIAIR